jgi:hypothetical protein
VCVRTRHSQPWRVAAAQQPTGDPFSTEIRKIKDGLFVIPGYDGAVTGGNVAVRVTSEGTIIVDDRFPPSSKEIAGKVRSVTSQPIKYVLSTHSHGDHSGGHPEFISVAEIIAHRNNRANMIRNKQAAPLGWCLPIRRRCFSEVSKSRRFTLDVDTPMATRSSTFPISEPCTPATWSSGGSAPTGRSSRRSSIARTAAAWRNGSQRSTAC